MSLYAFSFGSEVVAHERRRKVVICERRGVVIVRRRVAWRKAQASNRSSTPKYSKNNRRSTTLFSTQQQFNSKANMALDFAATYKVLVLGDSNVGKTCIVHRYCDERYYDTYISTIGKKPSVEILVYCIFVFDVCFGS